MNELKKQAQAPYYMNLRAMDDYTVNVTSSFGAIASSRETRMRTLVPQVRLGSLELDNFKYNSQGAAQDPRRGNVSGVFLPLDDETTEGIREAIWRETLKRYKFAQQRGQGSLFFGCYRREVLRGPAGRHRQDSGRRCVGKTLERGFRRVQGLPGAATGNGELDLSGLPDLLGE